MCLAFVTIMVLIVLVMDLHENKDHCRWSGFVESIESIFVAKLPMLWLRSVVSGESLTQRSGYKKLQVFPVITCNGTMSGSTRRSSFSPDLMR